MLYLAAKGKTPADYDVSDAARNVRRSACHRRSLGAYPIEKALIGERIHVERPVQETRLYLPKDWAEDNERRCKAGIPEEIGFKTKPEIALERIQWSCEMDLPGDLVLIDAGYGNASQLRAGITELGKLYVAGIQSQTLVSKPGPQRGRAAKKRRGDASKAISVKELAVQLRAKAWHTIMWREGTNERLSSCFARVRVHVGASNEPEKSAEEWLLIEWPGGENEPSKYWLSTSLRPERHVPQPGHCRCRSASPVKDGPEPRFRPGNGDRSIVGSFTGGRLLGRVHRLSCWRSFWCC